MEPTIDPTTPYTKCRDCDYFLEEVPREAYALNDWMHLTDGDRDKTHEPVPGETKTLGEWKAIRPDLFAAHPDGKIGPNSAHHRPPTAVELTCWQLAAGPWAGQLEFVREMQKAVPHPFCVTTRHVAYASDHGGVLDERAMAAAPCGHCGQSKREHTTVTVVLIRLLKDFANAALADLLFPTKGQFIELKVDGFVIDENGFKLDRTVAP